MSRSTDVEHDLELVVAAVGDPAHQVRSLVLRHPAGEPLPVWTPGAHVDLHVGDGVVRQYSLCGDPADRSSWRIAVLREEAGRGGSDRVHDALATGDRLRVRGPRNHFPLLPAPDYVFVAGGIGITPLLPMVAAAAAAGARWRLEYGGRTRASMAFAEELRAAHGDRVRLHPQDEVGLLPLADLLGDLEPGTLVYCCGPGPLLQAVETACAGLPPGALHQEHFSPRERAGSGEARSFEAESFEVELVESGRTLTVPPDRSVLSVLEEAGVPILSSCTEGTCGTCETGVLGGEVEHRDSLLTAAEQAAHDVMFVCVSRAAPGCPRLLLEL